MNQKGKKKNHGELSIALKYTCTKAHQDFLSFSILIESHIILALLLTINWADVLLQLLEGRQSKSQDSDREPGSGD
jgi:hypothetical protein